MSVAVFVITGARAPNCPVSSGTDTGVDGDALAAARTLRHDEVVPPRQHAGRRRHQRADIVPCVLRAVNGSMTGFSTGSSTGSLRVRRQRFRWQRSYPIDSRRQWDWRRRRNRSPAPEHRAGSGAPAASRSASRHRAASRSQARGRPSPHRPQPRRCPRASVRRIGRSGTANVRYTSSPMRCGVTVVTDAGMRTKRREWRPLLATSRQDQRLL